MFSGAFSYLKKCLTDIENRYDFIIFDDPPNVERIKENSLVYTDYLILPTIPDDNALHGLLCLSTEIIDVKEREFDEVFPK